MLRQAEETGIHGNDFLTLAQGAYAALSVRDGPRALAYLTRLQTLLRPDRRGDAAHLDTLTGGYKMLAGDLQGARCDLERGADMVERLGMGFAALIARAMLAWVLTLSGELDRARTLIRETLARTQAAGAASIEFESRVALAYAELAAGNREAARDALREAFALGRRRRYFVTGPVWLPDAMSRLCAEALEVGIEPEYARELISRRTLVPPAPDVEHWPWPVRIQTLGRFGVLLAGSPLRFQRKSPGKPIQLLQALLALGGQEVAVGTLLDLLWPDMEGDDAGNAFNVTLLRLRRLLGEAALTLCDHKVSLNDRYCWVDAWALDRLVARSEAALPANGGQTPQLTPLAEQALRIYQGPFLPGEDAGWAAAARARLRSRFLRLQGRCARTPAGRRRLGGGGRALPAGAGGRADLRGHPHGVRTRARCGRAPRPGDGRLARVRAAVRPPAWPPALARALALDRPLAPYPKVLKPRPTAVCARPSIARF